MSGRVLACAWLGAFLFGIASDTCSASEIAIPGGGAPGAVVSTLAEAFNQSQTRHRVKVPPNTGAVGALRAVRGGESPLGRMARPLDEAESGEGLRCLPFARIPLAFAVGSSVKVRSLSEKELAEIFSGKIKDWKEVGGDPMPIRVIVRAPGEAAHLAIRAALPAFGAIEFGKDAKLIQTDEQVLDVLDKFATSIGWATVPNLAYTKTNATALRLGGVEATLENLANGKYPLAVPGCFLHRSGFLFDGAARAFLDFVFSPAGSEVIRNMGALPVARQW
jgi:phosphate transport system substrate-binding protein